MIGDNVPKILAAREGFDVRSAEIRNLTIDSRKNQFKVIESGSGTLTLNSSTSWDDYDDISHNLGYKPFVLAWHENESGDWVRFPYFEGYDSFSGPAGGIVSIIDQVSDNTTRFRIYEQEDWSTFPPSNPPDRTLKYKYLIFVDPLQNAWYE